MWEKEKYVILKSMAHREESGICAFERFLASIGNPPEEVWRENPTIRGWVWKNKNYRYVPEKLLNAYHMRVWGE